MNQEEQSKAVKEYEEADRFKGFDFKSVPLDENWIDPFK